MPRTPRTMEPAAAAEVLRKTLRTPTTPMTVADASVASGLALRDAEAGLTWLTKEYRGHLRVTEDGDLVHLFPHGFSKPWETREASARVLSAVGSALVGAGRFVLRAWLLIAMVGYAVLFVAAMIALVLARGSNDRGGNAGLYLLGGLLRAIADALFWTFHPFSPLAVGYGEERRGGLFGEARSRDQVPFYERVNRFVMGPPVPAPDPHAARVRILDEIRAKKGRIGLADVMRVTGLPRDQADPLMAELMLDHDGTVEVAEQGGIVYRFEALRRTAMDTRDRPPPGAAWEKPATLPPLTGNPGTSNALVALLNGFNVAASAWAIAKGLTLANLFLLLTTHTPRGAPPLVLPYDGVPIALGVVPLVFSLAIFLLPVGRFLARMRRAEKVARENARLGILREVLAHASQKTPVPDEALRTAYRVATGEEPSSAEITARVVDLGGDVAIGPEGEVRYRFVDLEAEAEALAEEREEASETEAKLGRVVFASDD